MKKLWKAAPLALCGGVVILYAATLSALTQEQTFDVSVSIPTLDFHVLPVDPQLLIRQQDFEWDVSRKVLRPLNAQFDVKSSAGAVNAYLDSEPVMQSASNTFGLTVRFNNKTLTILAKGAVQVLGEQEAHAGKRVTLEILPIPPATGYVPGLYYGSVRMIFDAVFEAGADA